MERVTGLPHVQARQRTPGTTNRVKCPAFAMPQHAEPVEGLLDKFFGLLQRFACNVLQRKPPKGQRHAIAHAPAAYVNQLERAAPEIAHDAIRLVDTRNHTESREIGLTLARKN